MSGDHDPPLFEGEPEKCALCGVKGHTHDQHWLDVDDERAFKRELFMRIFARRPTIEVDACWRLVQTAWRAKPEDC